MRFPETLLHDLRFGIRMLFRNAGSTAVTVLALALGVGVNTAVFTAYKALITRPLDARNSAEMVNVALSRELGGGQFTFSYPDYETYRDSIRSFSGLVAFRPAHLRLSNAGAMISQRSSAEASGLGRLGLLPGGAGNVEFASSFVVSENYFEVLGVPALIGRTFGPQDAADRASPPVLISENYWKRRFKGDAAILGRAIHLNGVAVTIIGVTPHDFIGTGVGTPAFWVPTSLEALINGNPEWLHDRENQRYRLFGRLASGVGISQAQGEMNAVAAQLRTLHDPQSDAAKPATVLVWPGSPFPLPLSHYAGLHVAFALIMAASAMVLAVACANVGSLQLARVRSRDTELRTRLSLGAARSRIVRQLVTESAVLGVVAGGLALLFSWAFLKVVVTLAAGAVPIEYGTLVFEIRPDLAIFGFVFAVSLLAGILAGVAPAIESSRAALSSVTRGGTVSAGSRRLQDVLVTVQVALSLVLMIAGSMLIRTSIEALKTDTGYDAKEVIDLEFQFPESPKYTTARKLALVQELRTNLSTLPGVASVTSARSPVLSRFKIAAAAVDETKASHQDVQWLLDYTYVEPNYFKTLGIPLLLGRSFQPQRGRPEQSVLVSESAARTLWPSQSPIGRSLRLGLTDERPHNRRELIANGAAYEVIGVVGDKRGVDLAGTDSKEIYLPLRDDQVLDRAIMIRCQSDPSQVVKAIDTAISAIDPELAVTSNTLGEMLRQSPLFIVSSLGAAVASIVGLFGLTLASLGIYGTVSYIVVLRTREVGIRMAIGAQKRDVLGLILAESARPVIVGLAAGICLAIAASYLLRSLLFELAAVDIISLAGVSALFLVIALLASGPPARRAMRVDPIVALRYE